MSAITYGIVVGAVAALAISSLWAKWRSAESMLEFAKCANGRLKAENAWRQDALRFEPIDRAIQRIAESGLLPDGAAVRGETHEAGYRFVAIQLPDGDWVSVRQRWTEDGERDGWLADTKAGWTVSSYTPSNTPEAALELALTELSERKAAAL